jgi:hypothetical protein
MVSNAEIKKLVLMRLETMPETIKISLGSNGEMRKADLIKHVKEEDELGKLFIEVQLDYLRSMKGF